MLHSSFGMVVTIGLGSFVSSTAVDIGAGLNLLQLRSSARTLASTFDPRVPDQCVPKPPQTEFGCRGELRAPKVHWCHLWGEPHITSTFNLGGDPDHPANLAKSITKAIYFPSDPFYNGQFQSDSTPGLRRLAKAADGSWEVQVFSCGLTLSAAAIRFGDFRVEVAVGNGTHPTPHWYINGVRAAHEHLPGALPNGGYWGITRADEGGMSATGSERTDTGSPWAWGSCGDDPMGQVSVQIDTMDYGPNEKSWANVLSIIVHAARDSWESDELSVCDAPDSEIKNIPQNQSLFRSFPDELLCDTCRGKYGASPGVWSEEDSATGLATCRNYQTPEKELVPEEECEKNGLHVEEANTACEHLKDKPVWFGDCVYDVCVTGFVRQADGAEIEEAEELPEPKCANESAECDHHKTCCDAFDVGILNFTNVVQNNLDGSQDGARELRYGSVLGGIDLVITSATYSNKYGNANNGVNGVLGKLNINVGDTQPFNFSFVQSGTAELVSPGNAVISFLDLDQGKRGKQRETVKVCGISTNPLLSTNTELEIELTEACATARSTQKGTGEDNPDDPASLSDMHRARAIAFPINGQSTFSVELGVSRSGKQTRAFLFTGHPTVACVTP